MGRIANAATRPHVWVRRARVIATGLGESDAPHFSRKTAVSDADEFEIPEDLRPDPEQVSFDLNRALSSVVLVQAGIPEDAFTAPLLGTERAGHGVLIDDAGLVLTIGYLITEAETVWLIGEGGRVSAAHVLGYDQETGFGLVQSLDRLDLPAMELGNSADLDIGERVIVAGYGGPAHAINANVISKREFAGYMGCSFHWAMGAWSSDRGRRTPARRLLRRLPRGSAASATGFGCLRPPPRRSALRG